MREAAHDDLEALGRVKERERELDARLDQARRAAELVLAAARAEAAQIAAEAARTLEDELARRRAGGSGATEAAVATAAAASAARLDAIRARAGAARDQAIARLVAVVGAAP